MNSFRTSMGLFLGAVFLSGGLLFAEARTTHTQSYEFYTFDGVRIDVNISPENELTVRFGGRVLGSRSNVCGFKDVMAADERKARIRRMIAERRANLARAREERND